MTARIEPNAWRQTILFKLKDQWSECTLVFRPHYRIYYFSTSNDQRIHSFNGFSFYYFQVIASKIAPRLLPQPSALADDILFKSIQLRCIIENYLHGSDFNETDDRKIIDQSLTLIGELYTKSKTDKEFLLYNEWVDSCWLCSNFFC